MMHSLTLVLTHSASQLKILLSMVMEVVVTIHSIQFGLHTQLLHFSVHNVYGATRTSQSSTVVYQIGQLFNQMVQLEQIAMTTGHLYLQLEFACHHGWSLNHGPNIDNGKILKEAYAVKVGDTFREEISASWTILFCHQTSSQIALHLLHGAMILEVVSQLDSRRTVPTPAVQDNLH